MEKVILLGIDGADWRLINPMLSEGILSTFGELIQHGFSGVLKSTIPPLSLPAWTSIFTGVNPGKHGLIDVIIRENNSFKISTSKYRMIDPIWCNLSRKNLRSIIVNDPTTFPPDKFNGIMVSGMMAPPTRNFTYPSTIIKELDKTTGGYWNELPSKFYKLIERNKEKAFNLLQQFAVKTINAGIYLAQNYDWNFLAIIVTSTDRLQHFYLKNLKYIKKHYQLIDKLINKVVNLTLSENAQLIITSDHGFQTHKYYFNINALLKHLDLQKRSAFYYLLSQLNPKIRSTLKDLISRTYNKLNKKILLAEPRDIAFAKTSSGVYFSNTINVKIKTRLISLLIDILRSIKGPDGVSPVKKIFRNEEILWGPYIHRAPEIIFLCNEGYSVSSDPFTLNLFEPPFYRGALQTGSHRLEGIFIAYGSYIRKKSYCPRNKIFTWDIMPTVLHILGLPIPHYVDGQVRKEIFKANTRPAKQAIVFTGLTERERIILRVKGIKKKKA